MTSLGAGDKSGFRRRRMQSCDCRFLVDGQSEQVRGVPDVYHRSAVRAADDIAGNATAAGDVDESGDERGLPMSVIFQKDALLPSRTARLHRPHQG
ncbi:hypothetical protein ACIGO9_19990 [Nocardia asteroides]|uniref:hypothetical protein n=1 Tax=Nocardia asteroides TaxID=1824 RepID=UPI0037C54EB8